MNQALSAHTEGNRGGTQGLKLGRGAFILKQPHREGCDPAGGPQGSNGGNSGET